MLKTALLAAVAASTFAGAADAVVYEFDYSGTSLTTGAFSASVFLDVPVDGGAPAAIGGTRNGVAITGLSTYAGADNLFSKGYSYVDYLGLSYTTAVGTAFNVYWDGADLYELAKAGNPEGNANGDALLTSASVTTVDAMPAPAPVAASTVPEAASWAMMLGGFGLIGAAMRRRTPAVTFA